MYRTHIEKLARTRLDDVLLDEGVIERSVAEDALAEQEVTGRPLSEILFERQAIDEWDLAKIVATHYGLPFIDVKAYDIPRAACDLLPPEFCRERLVMPFDVFGHAASFAVVEMPRPAVLAEIERLSGKAPFLFVAVRRPILDTLDEWEADARKKAGGPLGAPSAPRPAPAAAPTGAAASVAEADAPASGLPDADVPEMELVMAEPDEPAPEPTAHVAPPNRGVLGALPAAPLALGPGPAGIGAAVTTAGALGRMSARPETPAAPAAPEPAASDWQSIFEVEE